jgi:hypothetical protein
MGWAEPAVRMAVIKHVQNLLHYLKERDHLVELGTEERMSKLILSFLKEKRYELDSNGSGQVPVAGSCEHGNEPAGCMRGGEFVGQLSDCDSLSMQLAGSISALSSATQHSVLPQRLSVIHHVSLTRCDRFVSWRRSQTTRRGL